MIKKHLTILENEFTIHRFDVNGTIPKEVYKSKFYWIGKTDEELSIVCQSNILTNNDSSVSNWVIIKVVGNLDFSLVGILAEISAALKNATISIIALSTYDTDYIMLQQDKLNDAKVALQNIGFEFIKTS